MRRAARGRRRAGAPPDDANTITISEAARRFVAEAIHDSTAIRSRVLELVHDIRFRDDIDTARVRVQQGRFLLELSPRFVETHLPAPEDKCFVLLHELQHLERGDLLREGRFYRRFPRLVNFAMDIYVNGAVLSSGYFDDRIPRVLDRCYDPRSRPWCLLQPPSRLLEAWAAEVPDAGATLEIAQHCIMHRHHAWNDDGDSAPATSLRQLATVTADVLAAVGFRHAREAARLYLGGWTRTMPFNAFLERFHRLLEAEDLLDAVEGHPLLLEHDLEALADELRRGGIGAGRSDAMKERCITPAQQLRDSPERQVFYQALRAALVSDPANPTLNRNADVMFPSVLLHMGRREAALLATGTVPVLYQAPGKALALSDERVHLYLDVSGSMDDVLAFVTGLTLTVGELIGPQLHQFSNEVVTVTWQQLSEGHVATTGGTDFDCIAHHASRNGYRRILILTDGCAHASEESIRILKRQIETYVIIPDSILYAGFDSVGSPVADIARKWWKLPQ